MARNMVKKGDTLIEVVLSFVMFSLVAAISLAVMHAGISGAEAAIELTLARVEIDSQSETLRFIQESFANDRAYVNLWNQIVKDGHVLTVEKAESPNKLPELSVPSCSDLYDSASAQNIVNGTIPAFVVNPRRIGDNTDPNESDYWGNTLIYATDATASNVEFTPSSLNPRIIYTTENKDPDDNSDNTLSETDTNDNRYNTIARVEGIYDFVTKDTLDPNAKPDHYDFYIYTCWLPPGAERPTTIGTVTRLFNPEYLNEKQ